LLTKFHQALIEMESVAAATAVLEYSRTRPVVIKDRCVVFNYSKSQTIKRTLAVGGDTVQPTEGLSLRASPLSTCVSPRLCACTAKLSPLARTLCTHARRQCLLPSVPLSITDGSSLS